MIHLYCPKFVEESEYTFPEFICRYHMSHENEATLSKL